MPSRTLAGDADPLALAVGAADAVLPGLALTAGPAAGLLSARAADDEETARPEPTASTADATTAVPAASTRVRIACPLRPVAHADRETSASRVRNPSTDRRQAGGRAAKLRRHDTDSIRLSR
jgi:hypothetical protein